MIESSDRFLDWCVTIRSMSIDQINILETETLERIIHALNDVLARKTEIVHWIVTKGSAPVDLKIY